MWPWANHFLPLSCHICLSCKFRLSTLQGRDYLWWCDYVTPSTMGPWSQVGLWGAIIIQIIKLVCGTGESVPLCTDLKAPVWRWVWSCYTRFTDEETKAQRKKRSKVAYKSPAELGVASSLHWHLIEVRFAPCYGPGLCSGPDAEILIQGTSGGNNMYSPDLTWLACAGPPDNK